MSIHTCIIRLPIVLSLAAGLLPLEVLAAPFPHRDATYPWLASAQGQSLLDAVPAPTGFSRVPTDAWGNWLRHLPLKPEGALVHQRDGQAIAYQRRHARVVDMDVLAHQECADAILRLRAEYLQSSGKTFRFSGMEFRSGTRQKFDGFLVRLFANKGTVHLDGEMKRPTDRQIRPGDVLVFGGSPGHAILVLDVAQRGDARKLLIGNGYMPAQEFHVLRNPAGGVWFDEADLATALRAPPPYKFNWTNHRRF